MKVFEDNPNWFWHCSFLVAAMVLQCMWSLSVATIEGYALLLGRSLRESPLLSLFAVGDWVS